MYGLQGKGMSSNMQAKMMTDPNYLLQQELMKVNGSQQSTTGVGAAAKALSMMASAYGMKQLQEGYKARGNDYAQALTGASSNPNVKTGVPAFQPEGEPSPLVSAVAPGMDTMIANLMSGKNAENPDVQEYVQQLQGKSLEAQQKQALTPYQEESLMLRRDMMQQKEDERRGIAEEKLAQKNDKLTLGKQNFEDSLANMATRYEALKKGGGISSTQDSGLSNAVTSLQTSAVGQGLGKMFGTENQSQRNQIAADIPLLTNAIKEATGMSAQQMNSNMELQTFLKALSNPENDYEANMAILANLSKKFGTGEVGKAYGGGVSKPSQGAIDALMADPSLAPQFEQKYGISSKTYLGL